MKKYDDENILKFIRSSVFLSNQKTVAINLGISQQFLCDVLKGRRPITDRILKEMGFKRISYIVGAKTNAR